MASLSLHPYHGTPIMVPLSWQPYHDTHTMASLSLHPYHGIPIIASLSCTPIMAPLSWHPYHGTPTMASLSLHPYHVPLSWHPYHGTPTLAPVLWLLVLNSWDITCARTSIQLRKLRKSVKECTIIPARTLTLLTNIKLPFLLHHKFWAATINCRSVCRYIFRCLCLPLLAYKCGSVWWEM